MSDRRARTRVWGIVLVAGLMLAVGSAGLGLSMSGRGGRAALPAPADPRPVQLANAIGDPVAGEAAFLRCLDCHPNKRTVGHRVGPNLFGVIGRMAGSAPGYVYSVPLAQAGFEWDEAALAAWLISPDRMVPGNAMTFQGVDDPVRRNNIVAYIATLK